jgi:adenine-specific DNA-methyltransferase
MNSAALWIISPLDFLTACIRNDLLLRDSMFRYFGSKASTSSKIADLVGELVPNGTVADAFGGLGTIGAVLRARGHRVTTCDILTFPHYFQISRIECKGVPSFKRLRDALDIERGTDLAGLLNKRHAPASWFVKEYSKERKFFTSSNASRIAGIWHQIVHWDNAGLLDRRERAFLVTSLLNSMDSVANTAGTYYAHLKEFHRKALKPFQFDWISVTSGRRIGRAVHGDALGVLQGKAFDLLYLDPPYNSRNYAGYYHLPESLALLKRPNIRKDSASGVPTNQHLGTENIRSGMTLEYLEKIISNVEWGVLIVHYCSDGFIPLKDLNESLCKFGNVRTYEIDALGYTTTKIKRSITHHVFVVTRFETGTTWSTESAF